MIIYQVTHIRTGRQYIGRTVSPLRRRWARHVWGAAHRPNQIPLWDAIRRDGPQAFEVEVVQVCKDRDAMVKAEYHHIRLRKARGILLFNLTDGGNGSLGYRMSELAKAKLSESARRRYARGIHPREKPCRIDGVNYPAIEAAAKALDVSRQIASRWAKSGIGRRRSERSDRQHGYEPFVYKLRVG